MDLYQLRYFLEVARELSFTRAAGNLHVSPPAVSKSVSLLERSLKRRLFTRDRRQVTLTAEGRALKARAERVFDELERARREVQKGSPEAPAMLKVGSREMITHYLLTEPLAELARRFPETRFGLYELGPKEMGEALKKDQLDLGFFYSGDFQDQDLEVEHLGSLSSHVYAAARLARAKPLPFVAPRYFGADRSAPSLDGFPDQRVERHIRYEAEFMETHRRLVVSGLAAAVLPDLVVAEHWRAKRLVRLPGPPLGREIYFITRRGRPLPEAAHLLRDRVRGALRRLKRI